MRASAGRRPATAAAGRRCTACISACIDAHKSTHVACINVVLLLLSSQLFPVEGSPLRKGMEDPAQWLASLWEPEAHGSVASQFLMGVQVGLCCGQERREGHGIDPDLRPRMRARLHTRMHACMLANARAARALACTCVCSRTEGARTCNNTPTLPPRSRCACLRCWRPSRTCAW